MAIWLSFLLIFCLLTSCYLFFLFKKKINKWQWLFISYYFLLAVGVNSLKTINNLLILSLTSFTSQIIVITAIISFTIIIFAIPATFFTAKFKKRKLYIWWIHSWLLLTSCLTLIVANVWTLILLNIALGMSAASLGVHELMFNEQYFSKSHAFLTFTILIVPGLLASLIIVPINIFIFNVATITINKLNYYLIIGLCFIILTFFLSFWLRENPKNIGRHEQIVLKKIKTFAYWKIISLITIGLAIYLIYYLTTSRFFNYKIISIDQNWISYKLLFTTLPQVASIFFIRMVIILFF